MRAAMRVLAIATIATLAVLPRDAGADKAQQAMSRAMPPAAKETWTWPSVATARRSGSIRDRPTPISSGALPIANGAIAAIADCTEAIRLDPKFADAYNLRGNAYAGKGERLKAIADYTEAIRLNPQYGNAYCNRGCWPTSRIASTPRRLPISARPSVSTRNRPTRPRPGATPTQSKRRFRQGDCRLRRGHPPQPAIRLGLQQPGPYVWHEGRVCQGD